MERVAFLIEQTGERVFAMINPDELIFERLSGVRMRQRHEMPLAVSRRSDDPMIYVGGGTTDLTLNLLFDVDLLARSSPSFSQGADSRTGLWARAAEVSSLSVAAEADLAAEDEGPSAVPAVQPAVTDVRDLSGPLWRLTENSSDAASVGPPIVHFIWGAAWNVPCVAISVAERFDQFSADGTPLRSWVRMRLRRTHLPSKTARAPDLSISPVRASGGGRPLESMPESVVLTDPTTSARPDLICDSVYGDLTLLHPLLQFNDIDDVWSLEPGRTLVTPPASVLRNEP
jgi:hypothetical protein